MSFVVYSILLILFFVSTIFQMSFLPFLMIGAAHLNIVFMLFFAVIFFEDQKEYEAGLFSVVIAGSLLDMYVTGFGTSLFSLLITYGIFKLAMHFLKDNHAMFKPVYFSILFLLFFVIYNSILAGFTSTATILDANSITTLAYNTLVAVLVFWVAEKYLSVDTNRQLTLFK